MPINKTDHIENSYMLPGTSDWKKLSPHDVSEASSAEDNQKKLQEILLSSLQMQNLCVLAGSGTSYGAAGGASMTELWEICALTDQAPKTIRPEVVRTAKKLNYDLAMEQPNIEAFLSMCESYLQIKYDDTEVAEVLKSCKASILARCSTLGGEYYAHRLFLQRLSRRRTRDSRLKVFTTNYDLCFESAANEIGLVVIDGFSFNQPRRYDPKYFTYDIVRRPRVGEDVGNYLEGVIQLFKLHGSVNWNRDTKIINNIRHEIISETSISDPDKACLIYPAKGKYQQTYIQPHLELFAQYLASLREPNTCLIVSGFGFNDDHLSEPLLSAIQSNSNLRLIICDPAVDDHIKSTDLSKRYWSQIGDIAEKGGDIYFIKSDFSDFASYIPDLRALTSADKLASAVRNAVGGRNEN